MKSTPEGEHLALLLKVNAILSSSVSLESILSDLIEEVIESLRAERGFVVLRQDTEWKPAAGHYVDPERRELAGTSFSRSVVETVASNGQAVLTVDALEDDRFQASSILIMGLRSIVCAPLRWGGEIRGVVYADHSVRKGQFTPAQLHLLVAIADQASRALENAALYAELQRAHQAGLSSLAETPAPAPGDDGLSSLESQAGHQTVQYALESLSSRKRTALPLQSTPSLGVRIFLFGPFRVFVEEREVEVWPSRKDRDLLAYLAAHRGQVLHEEKLMDAFWSRGGRKGQHSLHNSITQIRKILGDAERTLVVRKLDGYTLGPGCWTDLESFAVAYRSGRTAANQQRWAEAVVDLERAERLASGEFLEGSYAEWALGERERLAEQASECRALLAQDFGQRGKHVVAIELWKRVLEQDSCSETAYRGLLSAYRALGRQADAVRAYQACVTAFEQDLGLPPPPDLEPLIHF